MIVKRTIDAQPVLVECAAALEPAACDVLRTLAELSRSGTLLHDGLRMRFGWSLLTLRTELDGLRVYEPLFTGDAERELNPQLDITLRVLAAQVDWLHRLHEEGSDVLFDQQIVVAEGALSAAEILALRGEANSEADSGWSVAPVPAAGKEIDMTGLQAVPIHQLVTARPGLLPILILPIGYLVRLKANEVVEVNAPDGQVVWHSPASSAAGK